MADYSKYRGLDLGATEPAPDLDAPEGYPRDPDPGEGLQGSAISAFFIDYPRQVLHRAITALGGSPDIRDPGRLATVLGDALGAVLGWPAGSVQFGSTPRSLAAIAANAAGFTEGASRSLIAAAQSCVVAGVRALAAASRGSTVWGADSALLASRNAVLTGDNRLGGGYSPTAATGDQVDQNLTWVINSQTGEIKGKSFRTDNVQIQAGGAIYTPGTIIADTNIGTSGNIAATGEVTGGVGSFDRLTAPVATVAATYDATSGIVHEWAASIGGAAQARVTITNDNYHALASNGLILVTVTGERISNNSLVLATPVAGAPFPEQQDTALSVAVGGAGQCYVQLRLLGLLAPDNLPWSVGFNILIVNPRP